MLKNIQKGAYFVEADAYLTLFGRDVRVSMDDESLIDYAEKCIAYFNSFDEALILRLCEASIRYSDAFLDYTGNERIVYSAPGDVLNHAAPLAFLISGPQNGDEPVLHMELNCEWETEHGMEWIVRGDKVLYVGGFDGNDPWGDFSSKGGWNYA